MKTKKIIRRFKNKLKHLTKGRIEKLIDKIIKQNLTYLSKDALALLVSTIDQIERKKIDGDFLELGVALGGSSILIAKLKDQNRVFAAYDSFEMMPEPSKNDDEDVHNRYEVIKSGESKGLGGNLYYGYEHDLLNKVKDSFKKFEVDVAKTNVKFIKGYYEDTLKINSPVAFAHIDCDWYDSVLVSLERITPNLVVGGVLVIDDYYVYSGCKKATDDFFSNKKDEYKFRELERLTIERIK